MKNNYCILILTHGRPNNVKTIRSLINSGYTGEYFLVVDDEDNTLPEYREKYGDKVLTFNKVDISNSFDEGDNFKDRRAIIYARNAAFDIASQKGYRYFFQFDDDYEYFTYRFDGNAKYKEKKIISLDKCLDYMIDFYISANKITSVAMAQNGDFIGGQNNNYMKSIGAKRKAMNSFLCDTENRFWFFGRINEDVNTYTCGQRRGDLYLTVLGLSLCQTSTQSNDGGMTDLYNDSGTYVKSFYSVMYCPSSVTIRTMGPINPRLHHSIKWNNTAPKILSEPIKKQ